MKTAVAVAVLAGLLSWWAITLQRGHADASLRNDGVVAVVGRGGGSGGRYGPSTSAKPPSDGATATVAPRDGDAFADSNYQARQTANAASTPSVVALFRPLTPPPAPPQPPTPRAGEHFALLGIIGHGDEASVLLRDQVDGRIWRGGKHYEIVGWLVAKIEEGCVTLKRGRSEQRSCL